MIVSINNLASAGTASTTNMFYAGQQMIESVQQQPTSPENGETAVTTQYVFSPRYVDSPILFTAITATYDATSSSWSTTSTSTYYYLTDANYNVTTLLNAEGGVVKRYAYTAYGTPTIYNSAYTHHLQHFRGRQHGALRRHGHGPGDGLLSHLIAIVQPRSAPSSPAIPRSKAPTSTATPAPTRSTSPTPRGWPSAARHRGGRTTPAVSARCRRTSPVRAFTVTIMASAAGALATLATRPLWRHWGDGHWIWTDSAPRTTFPTSCRL